MFGENICVCKEISKRGQGNDAKSIVIQRVHSRKINRKRGCHTHYDLVNATMQNFSILIL